MNDDPQTTATEINGSISTAAKRQNGLLKMALYLENCKSNQERSILEHNCSFWMKTLFQIFENHPVSLHAKLAHYCFYLLIQNSKNLSADVNRLISTTFIEKSVILLTTSSESLSKNALICLNELMSCYRSSCTQYKQKIENYVFHKLDSDSDEVIEYASMCFAKLPFLHKNTNNMDMWYSYFKIMIKNLNIILNELFDEYQLNVPVESSEHDIVEQNEGLNAATAASSSSAATSSATSNVYSGKSEKLFTKLNKDVENLDSYFKKSLKRFKACILALGNMLTPLNEEVVIKIRANEIIELLRRVYFFDFKKLIQNCRINSEARCLSSIMGDLINHTITFTNKFFDVAETNLLTYSNNLSYTLAHFSNFINENFLFKSISSYFDCLTHWMVTNGASSGFYKYSSGIIDILLDNIKPNQKNILSLENQSNKGKNKSQNGAEAQRQTCNQLNLYFDEKTMLNKHQQEIQNRIIRSALNCLREYVKNFNHKLTYSQFEKIQQTIVEILLSVQHNYHLRKPYDQNDCRLGLYENLLELCLTQNIKISPPLSVSISLFRNALNDSSNEIKSYAQQSLSILRAFTYPTLPIYFKEYQIQANAPIAQEQQVIMDTTTSKDQQQSIYSTLYNNTSTELNGNNGVNNNNSYDQNRDTLSVKKLNHSNSNENMLNNGAYNGETSSLKRKTSMENGGDDHYENINSMTKKFQNEPSSQNSQNSQYLKYNKILNNQASKAKPINNENSKQDSNGNEEDEEILTDEDEEDEEDYDEEEELDEENEEDEDEFDDAQNDDEKINKNTNKKVEEYEIEDDDDEEEDELDEEEDDYEEEEEEEEEEDEEDIIEEEVIEEAIQCEKALLNCNNQADVQDNKNIELNTSKTDETIKDQSMNEEVAVEETIEVDKKEKELIKKLVNESYDDDEGEVSEIESEQVESEPANSSKSQDVEEKVVEREVTLDSKTEMTVNGENKNIEVVVEVDVETSSNQGLQEVAMNGEDKKVEPENFDSVGTETKEINVEENQIPNLSVESLNNPKMFDKEMKLDLDKACEEMCMTLNTDAVKDN